MGLPRKGEGCGGIPSRWKGITNRHCVVRSVVQWTPDRCHRTTKANIRSHLYGGPQGWNPHLLRT
jgi:hypothetical protein